MLKLFNNQLDIREERLNLKPFYKGGATVTIKREDELHPFISGNKYRKLKYNVIQAQNESANTLLTFGGAYSNHIAAVAYAGKYFDLKTIGVIRGDELSNLVDDNLTLSFAKAHGMYLHFISRDEYRSKDTVSYLNSLKEKFGDFYALPEGGTNSLAVKGCEEILTEADNDYDYICTSVGTGGTMAGLINGSTSHQMVLGFSALKGVFQKEKIKEFTSKTNYNLIDTYCFGGYAKIDTELIRFINEFKDHTKIQLDPIYTGKMMFGIIDLLKRGYFKENSRILAIHTGGLQGISGMNQLLKKKKLQQIKV